MVGWAEERFAFLLWDTLSICALEFLVGVGGAYFASLCSKFISWLDLS